MEKRRLASGIDVAPLAFGGNVFGWTVDETASFQLLDHFTAHGFNLIDTADGYSRWAPGNKGGESETIIGNWIRQKGNRQEVVIATKVGSDMGQGKILKKEYILKAAEASLKRLQTDYIDLYQTHFDDLTTPVEETLEAYEQLVKQGKVKAIGTSNMTPERLLESLAVSEQKGWPAYQTLQPEYNLYNREKFEREYEPVCLERGIGVLNYYALASGFLTGKYRTPEDVHKSARGGGVVKNYLNDRGFRILEALDGLAKRYETAPASIALAWLIARPSITAPIASATSTEQLNDLMQAAQLKLDQEAITLLDQASAY
ncbi:MAG TPA: aldo/keto reductase [Flavisolibacter sp.]|jgi:aryl-alcohol dehydrogenase-like predicted oxidoreductase|nr:aldo/keto reductase [Flavisolibacter sp.]